MKDRGEITGRVVSGAGKGAFFTRLDWVQEQCRSKLGFIPYPGTLNLEISDHALAVLEKLIEAKALDLISPDSNFCSGKILKISVGGIAGAIVLPAEDVRVHGKNIVEIISPVRLKDALGIADGDKVTIHY